MDKHNIETVFKEYLHPLDGKILTKMADELKLDSYTKKLDCLTFAKLFIYAQLKELSSLGKISFKVKHKKKLQKALGLKSISKSQLSRKLSDLPHEIFKAVFHHLVQKIHQEFGKTEGSNLLGKIYLIDSSTISFCFSQYRWAYFRKTKAGIKLHTRVVFQDGETFPDQIILTPAKAADVTQLDALIVPDTDDLHVFDRGYFDFHKFDEYCYKNIRFCTRLKENTIIHVIEELPVDPSSTVSREAIVKLGSMKYPLRLIETVDSQGNKLAIIINDAKMSTQEISDLYRSRWQVELFFKWVKQHKVLKNCYGKSPNAVYNQVYIAMITFCLTLLMKKKIHYQGTLLKMREFLEEYWWRSFSVFIKEVFKEPDRTSSGRKKYNYELLFKETVAQFEDEDIELFNDLSYDPVH